MGNDEQKQEYKGMYKTRHICHHPRYMGNGRCRSQLRPGSRDTPGPIIAEEMAKC